MLSATIDAGLTALAYADKQQPRKRKQLSKPNSGPEAHIFIFLTSPDDSIISFKQCYAFASTRNAGDTNQMCSRCTKMMDHRKCETLADTTLTSAFVSVPPYCFVCRWEYITN